ncbi:MAG: hypothetical protein FJZ66_05075 [Bacteroidetes bacterium]|nr:hypothetical protein [Bacteroidota bacterium]
MNTYNTIMRFFWLTAAILIFIVVTVMGFMDGFSKWVFYYLFVLTSLGMYFLKTWMMKRFVNHQSYLEEQKQKKLKN